MKCIVPMQLNITLRDHSFSTFTKFSEKLYPETHTYVCVSGGKKY